MRLELSKLKLSRELSDETTAFSAVLVVDGKPLAHASNRGCGGSNDYEPIGLSKHSTVADYRAAQATIGKLEMASRALLKSEGEKPYCEALDLIVSRLMDKAEAERTYSRWCKRSIPFRLPDDAKPDSWRIAKLAWSPDARARVVAKYPAAIFLHERTPDLTVDLPELSEADENALKVSA